METIPEVDDTSKGNLNLKEFLIENVKTKELNRLRASKNQERERLKSYFTGMKDGVGTYLPRIIKAMRSEGVISFNKRSLLREINSEINKLQDRFLEQQGE